MNLNTEIIDVEKPVRAYIGLGSNVEQPELQIKNAITAFNILPGITVLKDSGYFNSRPMGPDDQPDYVNAVIQLETEMTVSELLKQCQLIEQQQGRIKTRRWGERTIDLDILLYAELQLKTDELTIPHPGISLRDFVYMPLLKINPEIEIPGQGLLNVIVQSVEMQATKNINTDYGCQYAGNIDR